jgi:hypothetical protein
MRYFIPILLFLLLLSPVAAQEETPFPEGLLADGVTILEQLPPLEPNQLFEQEGNWRIRDGRLCNITNEECTESLAQFDLYDESMGADCEGTWSDDAFITESPSHEWLIFTDCGTKTFEKFYTFFAYHLPSSELIELGTSDYTGYIETLAWLDNHRLLLGLGELRTSGGHTIELLNLDAEQYLSTIARQFAYKPRYFADYRLILWGEGIPDDTNSFLIGARRIFSYDVDTHTTEQLAQIDYAEPQQADLTVAFPIALSDSWLVVGDSFPLSSIINLYFFDRQTGELLHQVSNLPNREQSWQIANQSQSLYYWAYTYDGVDRGTTNTLTHTEISQTSATETQIMMATFMGELSLSLDENFLLIAWAEDNIVQIYDVQEDIYYSLLSCVSYCRSSRINFEWLPDNTLILSVQDEGHWRIRIEALSGDNS